MAQGDVPMKKRLGTIRLHQPEEAAIVAHANYSATVSAVDRGRLTLRDVSQNLIVAHVKDWESFVVGDVVDVVSGYVAMPDAPDDVHHFVTVRRRDE